MRVGHAVGVRRAVLWFRRDLRLTDHPALTAALAAADEVVPLFILDAGLERPAGHPRMAFLLGCLHELRASTGGALVVRHGDARREVPALVRELGAEAVFVTGETTPFGRRRDAAVGGRARLEAVGSPYAVDPEALRTATGGAFKVFTPFLRAWSAHGWDRPEPAPVAPSWATGIRSDDLPAVPSLPTSLPPAGEAAAADRLATFLDRLDGYAAQRDRPDRDATSRLSPYLRFGCLHPRQVLDDLGAGVDADKLRSEIAWREFYAALLAHRPDTAWRDVRPELAAMAVDRGPGSDERFLAWVEGRTGYPFVDAGMRQLAGEGWMHNRVRMVTASFLVKDLHLDWQRGARLFLDRLVDGDLASNNHGWQWVAGTGTDAAPFFRIFNPTLQGRRFDPDGDYIRRWIPELRAVAGPAVHEPWKLPGGPPAGYPMPIVDHAAERSEALARYAAARS
ncbi:MAG: deoxyribodipyrimidine photo-lyase [Acidimicrobiia bacterium]